MKKNDIIECRGHVCIVLEVKEDGRVLIRKVKNDPYGGFIWTAKPEECRKLTKLEKELR